MLMNKNSSEGRAFEADGMEVVQKFIMLGRPKRKAGGSSSDD